MYKRQAHDCADIEGRPAVYTWSAHEIPAFIRHNFPNTSDKRDAWMLGGFSAGAYCAVWTAMRTPQTLSLIHICHRAIICRRLPENLSGSSPPSQRARLTQWRQSAKGSS